MTCVQCRDVGWVLDCDPTKDPLLLELIPCTVPDCERSGRSFELVSLPPGLRITAPHPTTGDVMSVARTTARKYPLNGICYTTADDLEMLSHREDWPEVLHVRRRDRPVNGVVSHSPQVGMPPDSAPAPAVRADAPIQTEEWPDALLVKTTSEPTPTFYVYKNASFMVADGWSVD